MTKPFSVWQQEFAAAAKTKFGGAGEKKPEKPIIDRTGWTQQDRLLSITRQLADVTGAVQKELGIFPSNDPKHTNPNHRIAALIADILLLCDARKFDLEAELADVLAWYRDVS